MQSTRLLRAARSAMAASQGLRHGSLAGGALLPTLEVTAAAGAPRALNSLTTASANWSSNAAAAAVSLNPFPLGGTLNQMQTATLLPGEGIGEEVTGALVDVFEAADVPLEFETFRFSNYEDGLPQEVIKSFQKNLVAIKGPFTTPVKSKYTSINLLLRRDFDLFANVVHAYSIPGVKSRLGGVDVVMIRENTEGEYSGMEHEAVPGVVESLKIITEVRSMRIAQYAFAYAAANNRKKVTAVHKANIMKSADGLFLDCCKRVAAEYPHIEFEGMIVDNTCMQMVSRPQQFDVMILPNLYGNIVTNIAAGICGGPGLFPGANIGETGAIFEQGARHSGLDIAGKNKANPTGQILGGVMMLRYLQLTKHADAIESAVMRVLEGNKARTPDIGGSATTTDYTKAIISHLE